MGGGGLEAEFPKVQNAHFTKNSQFFLLGTPLALALREGVPYDLGTK